MAKIILSHKTALKFIRIIRIRQNINEQISTIQSIINSKRKSGNQKLDILVNSDNKKARNWRYIYHVHKNSLPRNSIKPISENINLVCPELLLIQLAKEFPYEILSLIALEFCGTYCMDQTTGEFISNLQPITSVEKIKNYVNKYARLNKNAWGLKNIREVCKILEDNSASPMESRLYVKLCGPRNKGLYSIKNLKFNQKITLSLEARKIAGQNIIMPDISCAKKKVAMEYNSSQFHENTEQGQRDQRRRDALVHDGWVVYSFTPQQVYDAETFRILALKILKSLDQYRRIRHKNFTSNNQKAFNLLR